MNDAFLSLSIYIYDYINVPSKNPGKILMYLKVKIDGLPIPAKVGFLKGPKTKQYVGTARPLLFNYCALRIQTLP